MFVSFQERGSNIFFKIVTNVVITLLFGFYLECKWVMDLLEVYVEWYVEEVYLITSNFCASYYYYHAWIIYKVPIVNLVWCLCSWMKNLLGWKWQWICYCDFTMRSKILWLMKPKYIGQQSIPVIDHSKEAEVKCLLGWK